MLRVSKDGMLEKVKTPTLIELDEKIDIARGRQRAARLRVQKELSK